MCCSINDLEVPGIVFGVVGAAGSSWWRCMCSWVVRDSPVLLQSQAESETGVVHVVVGAIVVVIVMYIIMSTATVVLATIYLAILKAARTAVLKAA